MLLNSGNIMFFKIIESKKNEIKIKFELKK